jgi:hypothetical protein
MSTINLIHLFNFYLAATFLLSVWRRWEMYRTTVSLVVAVPGRWPKLFDLVKAHHNVFLTLPTLLPAVLALLLLVIHTVSCRLIWPQADLTPFDLVTHSWGGLPPVALSAAAMLAMDAYTLVTVGRIERSALEHHFDRAEFWLNHWSGKLISAVTFGRYNVKQVVSDEVRKSLEQASQILNKSLWWTAVQTGLRVLFGLALWGTWALSPHPPHDPPAAVATAEPGK